MGTDSASSLRLLPVDSPPVSKVYQDQMATLSYGLALWNPNPPKEIYEKVSIGDVGYLYEGSFIRMFNVMLPWNHESNRTLGQPEPYEPLDCGPFANTLKRQFDGVNHYSRYVSAEISAGNRQAMTPDDVGGVTYKFRNCGAVLSLPNGGHHEDVIRAQVFEDYIQDYVDSWFTWARKNRLGVERVEDLILVSGCTLVTSWAAAAFAGDTVDAELALASRTLNNGGASFVWSNIRGRISYHNSRFEPFHEEQNFTTTQDQCVFIRGFRVKSRGSDQSELKQIRLCDNCRDDKMQVIRVSYVQEYEDPNFGVVDAIMPPIKSENPQRSPYQHLTLQRNDSLPIASCTSLFGDGSLIGGSSSSLETIGAPINHEDPQLLPYPSSTTLQSNGGRCNFSFMTSPSCDSSIEVPNYIAEGAQKIRHEDAFAEDITSGIQYLPLVDNAESLMVDAVDTLRENNTSLLDKNSAVTLRDFTDTNQMTTERNEDRFGPEMGSHLFRRMTKARFASLLGIRNPPPRPAPPGPVTEGTMPTPVLPPIIEKSSVPSVSQLRPKPRSRTILPIRYEEKFLEDPNPHSRTKTAPQPPHWQSLSSSPQHAMRRARSNPILTSPEHATPRACAPTTSFPSRRLLIPTVMRMPIDNPQFRILVVGKRGSGKSSLIKYAFRVNMSAAPGRQSDINLAFRPDDNHRLIVHEYSGLDVPGLRTIREFITKHTHPTCAPAERLHAIWICVPTPDAIDGGIGDIDGVLNMKRDSIPFVVAFTKSDLAYPHISGSEDSNYQYQDRTRTRAYAQCEELCRSLFGREARDVQAELVSVMPQYGALIDNLIATTDRFITGSDITTPSSLSSSQGTKPRIARAPLAWSIALRASRNITVNDVPARLGLKTPAWARLLETWAQ